MKTSAKKEPVMADLEEYITGFDAYVDELNGGRDDK